MQVIRDGNAALSGEGSDAGYAISVNGRYRHARQYVERVLANAELRSEIAAAELRLEAGEPVPGLVVRGTKPAAAGHATTFAA
jgi:predicted TPR repeat methyltransferase